MKKKLVTTLFILLLTTSVYAQTYTVERVIEGDTIVVTTPEGKSEKVRLIGIDCPESQPNDKAKRDSERTGQDLETINKMGQEATEFLKLIVEREGKDILLEFDVQQRDKYGRLLAYVRYDLNTPTNRKLRYWLGAGSFLKAVDGKWHLFVNETIVKSGYATPMTIPPNVTAKQSPEDAAKQHPEGKYADLFKELYEEARKERRGLWMKN